MAVYWLILILALIAIGILSFLFIKKTQYASELEKENLDFAKRYKHFIDIDKYKEKAKQDIAKIAVDSERSIKEQREQLHKLLMFSPYPRKQHR